ncbi:MAG: hypothetical protein SGJ24_20360 [Chloroflexota bacterium]|nr:hypothetical protein [Chloroflexota bacterium]
MNRLFRAGFALMLLAALLVIAPAAFAQDTTLGLSDADFAAWSAANENSAAFETLSLNFTSTLNVAGLGESPITWDLTGATQIGVEGTFGLLVTGEFNDGTQTLPVNFEVRLVGDMLYINADGSEWMGGKTEDALGSFAEGAGIDPAALASGDLSGIMGAGGADAMGAMAGLSSLNPSDFVAVTRDGSTFRTEVSISDLLQSPAIAGILGGAMGGGAEMTEAETQQMGMMMSMMFAEAALSYTQTIDSETNRVEGGLLEINLPLSALGMGEGAAVALTLDMNTLTYNEALSVEAPAEFTEMTAEAMMGS